jgi:hypothetical protein
MELFISRSCSEQIEAVATRPVQLGGRTMNSKILIIAAVLVVVAVAGYFYMTPEAEVTPTPPAATSEPANTQ